MPHHPSEEEAPSGLTDKVAQHSRDSTASDHPIHDENKGPVEQGGAEAFKSSPGPQIVEKLPDAESKDELKTKAAEMNK